MRRLAIVTLALVSTSAFIAEVRADNVFGTRSNELNERTHAIALRFDRTQATLVVQRTLDNRSAEYEQAMVEIVDLPPGAVAIGLRTQGVKNGQPIWYSGDLLEAELAARRYRELTGIGGYYPKDPALLSWRASGDLLLQVFPVDPKAKKTVEYTLVAPVRYENGRYELVLPPMGTAALRATVTLDTARKDDALFIEDAPAIKGCTRKLDDTLAVGLVPANPPTIDGTMASIAFGADKKTRALLHTSIAIAPRLSTTPAGAYVVVVLDASRSLTKVEREAEVAAARAYLGSMPDAHVEVLTFDRAVHARHGKFVPKEIALADLVKTPLVAANGSAIELALGEAKTRLAVAPAGTARRIVALTDLRTRDAISPSTIAGLESAGAIVHLAVIENGAPSLDRDDDNPWAKVVRATGGLVWRAAAAPDAKWSTQMTDVYEEWARPRKLEHVSLSGIGISDGLGLPETMPEGSGFEDRRITTFATPALEVHGELWATKVKTLLTPTPEQDKLWSALVFGDDDLWATLSDPEMMVLAMKGGAVSPVTSYLAIEPGVRPSIVGLGWGEAIGEGGLGLIGHGSGGSGAGMGIGLGASFSPMQWLRAALKKIGDGCGATGKTLSVRIETTRDEIVDVTLGAPSKEIDPLVACVREATWNVELPSFFTLEHTAYQVVISTK